MVNHVLRLNEVVQFDLFLDIHLYVESYGLLVVHKVYLFRFSNSLDLNQLLLHLLLLVIYLSDVNLLNTKHVWYLEGSHHLGRLPIEVDEVRAGSNPKNWRNERGKPCVLPKDHNFPHIDGYLRKGQIALLHSNVVHG